MHRINETFRIAAAALCFVVTSATAQPASEWKPTILEIRQLPPYCQAAFGYPPSTTAGQSIAGCGERFNHFCPALVALLRAEQVASPKTTRKYYLGTARDHLRYTRTHWAHTCQAEPYMQAAEMRARLLENALK